MDAFSKCCPNRTHRCKVFGGRINGSEQKNSQLSKQLNCEGTDIFQDIRPNLEVSNTYRYFCYKSKFGSSEEIRLNWLALSCAEKLKSGTDELTHPVNADFTQPVITSSANSHDLLSHTNLVFIKIWSSGSHSWDAAGTATPPRVIKYNFSTGLDVLFRPFQTCSEIDTQLNEELVLTSTSDEIWLLRIPVLFFLNQLT